MSPAQQGQLQRRQEQFASLEPAEQQRLRQLQQQLEDDPDAAQLRLTMQRYCDWLKTLPPYRRAELLEVEPGERIKRIKKLLQDEALAPVRRLNEQDAAGLFRWMDRHVAANEARFLQTVSETRRQQLAQMSPPMRRRVLVRLVAQRWQVAGPDKSPLTDAELADLRAQLSPASRERLQSKPPAGQWKIVSGWMRQFSRHQPGGRHSEEPLTPAQETALAGFFERELTDRQRERLLSMPGEEMQRELRRMYFQRSGPAETPKSPQTKKGEGRGEKGERRKSKLE